MTVEELTAAQTAYQKLTDLQAYKVALQTSSVLPVEVPINITAWFPSLHVTMQELTVDTVSSLIDDAQTAFDNL